VVHGEVGEVVEVVVVVSSEEVEGHTMTNMMLKTNMPTSSKRDKKAQQPCASEPSNLLTFHLP
jgi:hypothetical protein